MKQVDSCPEKMQWVRKDGTHKSSYVSWLHKCELARHIVQGAAIGGGTRHVVAAVAATAFWLAVGEDSEESKFAKECAAHLTMEEGLKSIAAEQLGEGVGVGGLVRSLRDGGYPQLAKSVSTLHRQRNSSAHPMGSLDWRVCNALRVIAAEVHNKVDKINSDADDCAESIDLSDENPSEGANSATIVEDNGDESLVQCASENAKVDASQHTPDPPSQNGDAQGDHIKPNDTEADSDDAGSPKRAQPGSYDFDAPIPLFPTLDEGHGTNTVVAPAMGDRHTTGSSADARADCNLADRVSIVASMTARLEAVAASRDAQASALAEVPEVDPGSSMCPGPGAYDFAASTHALAVYLASQDDIWEPGGIMRS
jgi:hypothetical protein